MASGHVNRANRSNTWLHRPALHVKKTLASPEPMVWTPPSADGGISGRRLRSGGDAMRIIRIGLDLAKYVFDVHGVDARGKVVLRKRLRRSALSNFFANLPPCLVGMEASNGAHYWARILSGLGHEVRLISPQFVTPYVKSNKNDQNDAEAICEAVGRPTMRFVPMKSVEQLSVRAVHRIRSRLVKGRTQLVNQVRGILAEHGIVIARNIAKLRQNLSDVTGRNETDLNDLVRALIGELQQELAELDPDRDL
jgi:transposase